MPEGINRRDSLSLLGTLAAAGTARANEFFPPVAPVASDGFTFTELPRRATVEASGALLTSGYAVPGIGGGVYRRCAQGPSIATRWRRQSRDGQWFEKDERDVDLTHMGATGDGKDATEALAVVALLRTLASPFGCEAQRSGLVQTITVQLSEYGDLIIEEINAGDAPDEALALSRAAMAGRFLEQIGAVAEARAVRRRAAVAGGPTPLRRPA